MTSSPAFARNLSSRVGPNAVLAAEGASVDRVAARAVVRPADRQQLSEVIRWATADGVRLYPRGGGVLSSLGNLPAQVDVILDLSGLNRIMDYQPADLTVTTEAGITLAALRRELVQGDKYVPLEAPRPDRATVGGILATGFSGPLRFSYGLPRDWTIGISVAGSDGSEARAGGRVVKNVTGYDLNKLYTGSLGTLGVIVEASFKLAPIQGTWAALAAPFPSISGAVAAAGALISQVYAPQGLQVVSRNIAARLGLDVPGDSGAVALAFISGRPRAASRRLEESARQLEAGGSPGGETLDESAATDLLARLTDLPWREEDLPFLALKVTLPPSNVGSLVAAMELPAGAGLIADPGFGTVHLLWWPPAEVGEPETDATLDLIDSARRNARNLGGAVAVEVCPPRIKAGADVWEGSVGEAELEIMRRIKRNFDPAGIFNPGRFVGRL
ncbi:MAG: FAD-binding oxidoreductase [Chloroflexota bacterium]|nr:FAD-binding oxidoreductase [Chloroflexota bacterium]